MADWPLTDIVPHIVHTIEREGPPTLVTRYEDGSESRRQKHANDPRRWVQKFAVNGTDAKSIMDFVATKKLLTSFTAITYDPESATPDTDTATVVFDSYPDSDEIANGLYHMRVVLREVF